MTKLYEVLTYVDCDDKPFVYFAWFNVVVAHLRSQLQKKIFLLVATILLVITTILGKQRTSFVYLKSNAFSFTTTLRFTIVSAY